MKIKENTLAWLRNMAAPIAMIMATGAAQAQEEVVLRVGVPSVFGYYVSLMERGVEVPGVKVEYKYFPIGNDLSDAINTGAVDVADSGDMVVVQYTSRGLAHKAVACTGSNGANLNLLVRPEFTGTDFSDLKGKKIAYNRIANPRLFVINLLNESGLSEEDIIPVDIVGPEAVAAFVTGQVDAIATNSPTSATILDKVPGARIIRKADSANVGNLFCTQANPESLKNKGEAIGKFITAYEAAIHWAKANPDEYVRIVSTKLGISPEAVRDSLDHTAAGLVTFDDHFYAEKQKYADQLLDLGILKERVDVRDTFDDQFNAYLKSPVSAENIR